MVGKPAWSSGLVYVDLFCGPGICTIEGSGKRIPGSPLIAANAPKKFSRMLLCEMQPELAAACETRLKAFGGAPPFEVFCGDCNVEIHRVTSRIPHGALTLALLDPTGLHVHMETVRVLAAAGAVDLLVLFPDAVDVVRNVELYFKRNDSNLDLALGAGSDWRNRFLELGNADGPRIRELFERIYREQLESVAGYAFFGNKRIAGGKGPLYRLVYASKNERGLDFWEKSVAKALSGQMRLEFE
jgi:three-Cys-motif partner protein